VAAALPQTSNFQCVGRRGKRAKEPAGLEPIKKSVPRDERAVVFEPAADQPGAATSAATFDYIALSKVAPAHVRTEGFKVSRRGRLSTSAMFGALTPMLLR